MKTRTVTAVILGVVTAALIAWDIFAYLSAGGKATISTVLLGWAGEHPVIVFVAGALAGHILFPQFRKAKR